jgi:hypothetical protein
MKKRIVMACAGAGALAWLGCGVAAGVAAAASPKIEAAIKAVEAVGADPARLKAFCELNELLAGIGDREEAESEAEKQIAAILAKIGPDFAAAWDVGEDLDENSADGQEFYAAVDELTDKCQ